MNPEETSKLREWLEGLPPQRRAQLGDRLRRLQGPASRGSVWFVRHEIEEPAFRLLCLPHAGGGASIFRSWRDYLPDRVEVCAVQLPGRESRVSEPPYRRLGALVTDLAEAIAPLLDRPYALFGHSMGALTAFELARQLRRLGAPQPEHLFLAAFRAPHLPSPNIRIYHLPDEVLKTVLAKDGTPQVVLDNREIMNALLPTLRADFELCDTYDHAAEAPLAVPMSIFGGLQDVRVARGDLEPWRVHAASDFSLSMLAGSHFFIRSSEDLLLSEISGKLRSAITLEGVQLA